MREIGRPDMQVPSFDWLVIGSSGSVVVFDYLHYCDIVR